MERCSRCGAIVTPGTHWCLRCFEDVRPIQRGEGAPGSAGKRDPVPPWTLMELADRELCRSPVPVPAAPRHSHWRTRRLGRLRRRARVG